MSDIVAQSGAAVAEIAAGLPSRFAASSTVVPANAGTHTA